MTDPFTIGGTTGGRISTPNEDPFTIGGTSGANNADPQPNVSEPATAWGAPLEEIQPPGGGAVQMLMRRDTTTFSGGEKGYVAGAIRANSVAGRDAKHYEWVITANLDNHSRHGENCAMYARAVRYQGAAWTFGHVIECRDLSGGAGHMVGMELDLFGTGPDTKRSRVGIDMVVGPASHTQTAPMEATCGLRISGSSLTKGNRIKQGVSINLDCDVGFDTSGATMSHGGVAYRLAAGQKIALEATNQICLRYNPKNGYVEILNGDRVVWHVPTWRP